MAETLAMATHALHPANSSSNNTLSCPSCGSHLPLADQTSVELAEAQQRITELESHVRILNEKATAAVEKWAGYEDELSKLRSQVRANNNNNNAAAAATMATRPGALNTDTATLPPPSSDGPVTPVAASPSRTPSILQSSTNRISAMLSPRKTQASLRNPASPAPPTPLRTMSNPVTAASSAEATGGQSTPTTTAGNRLDSPLPPTPANETQELINQLTREQSLRKEAQARLTATSKEVEELSAALFEQANEMVADERRARAKLEERVGELEKRDLEKRRRLERLEGAMEKIERVRNMLAEDGQGA